VDGLVTDTTSGRPTVGLIITEHPSFLTDERTQRYVQLARAISDTSDSVVSTCQYLDCSEQVLQSDALVLSGSNAPWDLHRHDDLRDFGLKLRSFGGPIFGICAGMQLLATFAGARLGPCTSSEVGFTSVELDTESDLFAGLPPVALVYQQHTDEVSDLPDAVRVIASNEACAVQALSVPERRWWGTQFHPELADELHPAGRQILERALKLLLPAQHSGCSPPAASLECNPYG